MKSRSKCKTKPKLSTSRAILEKIEFDDGTLEKSEAGTGMYSGS